MWQNRSAHFAVYCEKSFQLVQHFAKRIEPARFFFADIDLVCDFLHDLLQNFLDKAAKDFVQQ